MKYCANRPNVIWCKFEGKSCVSLQHKLHRYTSWNESKNSSVFILHFNHILPGDTGSYRCSANFSSGLVESHSITINVTGEFYPPRLSHIFLSCFKEKEDKDSEASILDTEVM